MAGFPPPILLHPRHLWMDAAAPISRSGLWAAGTPRSGPLAAPKNWKIEALYICLNLLRRLGRFGLAHTPCMHGTSPSIRLSLMMGATKTMFMIILETSQDGNQQGESERPHEGGSCLLYTSDAADE